MFPLSKSAIFEGYNLKAKASKVALEQVDFIDQTQLGLNYIILKDMKSNKEEMGLIFKLYEAGIIKLLYEPTYPNMAPFIPFESIKSKKMCVAINIAHHLNKNGVDEVSVVGRNIVTYDIDPLKLKGLLMAGAACLTSASSDGFRHIAVAKDSQIMLMANMWIKALSRVSTFATNAENASHFRYCFTKWIMNYVFGVTDPDTVKGVAIKVSSLKNYDRAKSFDIKYDDFELATYDVGAFIEKVLRMEFPQLSKLDLPAARSGFVAMGTINTLCMDYIPYVAALTATQPLDFNIYSNPFIKTELKDELKNAYISMNIAFIKRMEYLLVQ